MSRESRIKRRLEQELQGNPAFGVMVRKRSWLCPYCAELAVRGRERTDEGFADAVLEHLCADCPGWREFEGKLVPPKELRARARRMELRHRVKRALVSNPTWKLMHAGRRWVCPYCVRVTEVIVPRAAVGSDVVDGIVEHLDRECYAFRDGRPEKSLEHVRSVIAQGIREQKLAENVARKLEEDPRWRRRDDRHRWICPYCKRTQEHIDCSTKLLTQKNAPALIARHLLGGCERFQQSGRHPSLTAEAIRRHREAAESGAGSRHDADELPSGVRDIPTAEPDWESAASRAGGGGEPRRVKWLSDSDEVDIRRPSGAEASSVEVPPIPSPSPDPAAAAPGLARAGEVPGDSTSSMKALPEGAHRRDGPIFEGESGDGVGTTIGALQSSHEVVRIDEADVGPSMLRSDDITATSAIWREEIKRELERVKSTVRETSELRVRERSHGIGSSQASMEATRRVPEPPGYELRLILRQPPKQVAATEFHDFIETGDGRIAIVVGSVAGTAAEGGLITAMTKNLVRIHAKGKHSPAEVLTRVNADIFSDLDARTFVSLFLGILDPPTRRLRFARAGLTPPCLFNPRRQPDFTILEPEGMVLGIDRGPIFQSCLAEQELELLEGDMLVQLTNRVPEIRNLEGEEFGLPRMYRIIRRYGGHEADYLRYKFDQVYEEFTKGTDRSDEVVMVLLRCGEGSLDGALPPGLAPDGAPPIDSAHHH